MINGQQGIQSISFDPDSIKEDLEFVGETLLAALQEAQSRAKEVSDEEMSKVSAGMNFLGLV